MGKKVYFDLAIPTSFTTNLSSSMQRSFAVSLLSRAAAIYGVDRIYVYPDPLSQDRSTFKEVIKLLRYLITPPYLKRILFERDKSLSYVGALPPVKLKLFKEKVNIKDLQYPEYRVGLLVGRSGGGAYLMDVGLDKYVAIKADKRPRQLSIVRITKNAEKFLVGEIVTDEELEESQLYKGYTVTRLKESLPTLLERYSGLKIGLSRYGEYIGSVEKSRLKRDLERSGRVLLVLGAPEYGLREILNHYGIEPKEVFDYFLNLVYDQEVETIRVEEAVLIGLALMDYILHSK